jgi:hypothetical protein
MHAVIVNWDLSHGSRASFEELRVYLRERSIARFEQMPGLRQKTWISNPETGQWGAVYLFETPKHVQTLIDGLSGSPVIEMTGITPTFQVFEVEAVVEGQHTGTDLLTAGLARGR